MADDNDRTGARAGGTAHPFLSLLPFARVGDVPRGLYATKEGTMKTWSTEELVEALKESEWWPDFCSWADEFRASRVRCGAAAHPTNEHHLAAWIGQRRHTDAKSFDEPVRTIYRGMIALVSEITTGAIYGSPGMCACCGTNGAADGVSPCPIANSERTFYACHRDECEKAWDDSERTPAQEDEQEIVRHVLRVRRLLRERPAKPEAARYYDATPGMGCCIRGCHYDAAVMYGEFGKESSLCRTHLRDALGGVRLQTSGDYVINEAGTAKPAPVYPKPCPTVADFDGTCWRCGRPMRLLACEPADSLRTAVEAKQDGMVYVYKCAPCGVGFVSDHCIGDGKRNDDPTKRCDTCGDTGCAEYGDHTGGCARWKTAPPPKPEPVKCWKCGQPHDDLRALCLDRMGDDQLMCPTCYKHALVWFSRQDRLASQARDDLDRPTPRKPRVYQPEMVGTGGFNPFDPRRK